MIISVSTRQAPDPAVLVERLRQSRVQHGVGAARQTLITLAQRFPDDASLAELLAWHDERWWLPVRFGGITLTRQTAEDFGFVWSIVLDQPFSSKFMTVPEGITPRDVLQDLTTHEYALIPERGAIHWVVGNSSGPIGLAMLVNINFQHRVAELRLGIMPGNRHPFAALDAVLAGLLFAFNSLGMNKVQARIASTNRRAITCCEKAGFVREAVMRQEVWSVTQQSYEDIVQLSALQPELAVNPLYRYRMKSRWDPWLLERLEWPRRPLERFIS